MNTHLMHAVMDVRRILGYGNPRQAATMVKGRTRHVNVHTIRVSETDANHDSPGGNASKRGNPILNVVNEGGLHKLIMRSNKPMAQPFEVRDDGSVRCPHGPMRLIAPVTEDELEPPFGPYFRCAEIERVGIRRHLAHRPCRHLLVTSVVRHLLRQTAPVPEADITVSLGAARLHGKPTHIAEVLHRQGMPAAAY